MPPVAIVSIFIGVIIIISRGPLVLAPRATRKLYLKLLANNTRARLLGLFAAAVATAAIASARAYLDRATDSPAEPPTAVLFVLYLGYFLAAVPAPAFLVFPASVRRTMRTLLGAVDDAVLRWLGVFALALAGLFIYLGMGITG